MTVQAAPPKTSKKRSAKETVQATGIKIEKPSESWQWLRQRLSASAFIATADTISTSSASVGGEPGWALMPTSPSFGLQIQITDKKWQTVSWATGLSVEQDHELGNLTIGTPSGLQRLALPIKPSFLPVIMTAGLSFQPSFSRLQKYYFPIAVNYSVLNQVRNGDLANFSVRGDFGWQFGFGLMLKEEISFEMVWRQLNYKMSAVDQAANVIDLGTENFSGLLLSGRYWF
jgi:hypothetical protein